MHVLVNYCFVVPGCMCVISQMFLDLLEQPVDEQQDGEAITKAKHLYASCIDTGA